MKLNEKELRKYTYIRDVFDGTCELNDYKGISISCVDEQGKLLKEPIEESIKQMSKDENKCYLHATCFDKEEKDYFIALAKNEDNSYIDTEIVNIAVKFLHNLDIYDLIVTVGGTIDNKELLENLDTLDIPAGNSLEKSNEPYDKEMYFDVFLEDSLLVHGGRNSERGITYFKINYKDIEEAVDYDKESQELDAFIEPSSETAVNDAFIIGTNLKDAGFKVVTNYSLKKYSEDDIRTNFMIIVDESGIKNYEVILKDLKTKEKRTVKIDNLVEELSFL